MKKYVIIGNSAAAAGCVEGIRKVDTEGSITIISKEPHHIYSRPLISYLLENKTDMERMKYRDNNFYNDNNCVLISNVSATEINTQEKYVKCDNDTKYEYDKLLVATGSEPFVPPVSGYETVTNKFTFYTLSDALSLDSCATKDKKVLIIGAGLIGLKCAECLKDKVEKITVVDLAPKVLSSILDDETSNIMKNHLEKNGLQLILSDKVSEYKGDKAILDSGKVIDFDILVTAVGVRPQIQLVKDAGGEIERGIRIDSTCKTSLDDIYAAGDCTQSLDITDGKEKIMALLPNAYFQGECAGKNMAGEDSEFTNAIPMNSIGLFGLHIMTAGSYSAQEYVKKDNESVKKLFYKDNLLKGFIIIGDITKTGIYTSLIRNKTPLDSIDTDLLFNEPCLMAFSRDTRNKYLGGEK